MEKNINLMKYELLVNVAWVNVLSANNLISSSEKQLVLDTISSALSHKNDEIGPNIINRIGSSDGDIHTLCQMFFETLGHKSFSDNYFYGRSRNDTSVSITKMWLTDEIKTIVTEIILFCDYLISRAEENIDLPFISFTHQRPSDVTLFSQYLIAYTCKLIRCAERYLSINTLLSECPLGVGAMTGSDKTLDRHQIAQSLGFSRPSLSGIDSISDRGFVSDFVHACTELILELSNIAQDLLLWSTPPFPIVELSDMVNTYSVTSMKKSNPTLLFEIRKNTAIAIGESTKLNVSRRGISSGYCTDLSTDKEVLTVMCDLTFDTLKKSITSIKCMKINTGNVLQLAETYLIDIDKTIALTTSNLLTQRCELKRNFGGDAKFRVRSTLITVREKLCSLQKL